MSRRGRLWPMLRVSLPLVLMLLVGPVAARDEVGLRLAQLEAPDPALRRQAQRWLAVNLTREDFASVADVLGEAAIETTQRLGQVLGGDDRHFGLAALLLTDGAPAVRALGEAALREQALRWSASADDGPMDRRSLPDDWVRDWPRPISLDPGAGDLATLLDRLARVGAGPAPLVLGPGLDPGVRALVPDLPPQDGRLEGPWSEVLLGLVASQRVSFEVHGYREPGEVGAAEAHPWVHVCQRGTEGRGTGAQLWMTWVRGSLREHDGLGAAACSRALAATGWPAALAWLEERWVADHDHAALEGLLLAAARGRVVPSLTGPEQVRGLLAHADEVLGAETLGARVDAGRLARGLAAAAPIGPRGEPLTAVLLEGWPQLGGVTERWMRLVILEGQGAPSKAAMDVCDRVLAGRAPADLRRQALRTRLRVFQPGVDTEPPGIGSPGELLMGVADMVEAQALARDLTAVAARPLGGWRIRVSGQGPHLALALWALGAGELEVAGRELAAALKDPGARAPDTVDRLAGHLRRWSALGARGDLASLAAGPVPEGASPPTWRRLLLLAGATSPGGERFLTALLAAPREKAGVLLELGALATRTGPAGDQARDALVEAIGQGAPSTALLPALELAVAGLGRARLDRLDGAFRGRLRSRAAREGHPLAGILNSEDWPPRRGLDPPRLELLDRRAPR
jgi:hypothetical protein